MGKCERCGARPVGELALLDYCAECSKNLCAACMKLGCCGLAPAKSGTHDDNGPTQCDECDGVGGRCSKCGESPDDCGCGGDPERDHWDECAACDGTGEVEVDEEEEEEEED